MSRSYITFGDIEGKLDPVGAYDNLFGTPGEADVFVFEFIEEANPLNNSGVINGYEPGLDSIAYVNQPPIGTEDVVSHFEAFRYPSTSFNGLGVNNDPNIPDSDQYAYAGADGILVVVPDQRMPLAETFIYSNDPFLIA